MTELLHLTERVLWEEARAAGTYQMSTKGRTLGEVGFIHASLRHQLPAVARALYGERPEPGRLVVLVIDSERLTAPVRYEPPVPGGTDLFPHIYGSLPVGAVVDVVDVESWPGAE
ncbi:DUF952 domain-containing protein [Streptomyces sp. NPDC048172]|uniref:DUF952 domain-containing protein n=1 Tax=Streptomyces sp. NPDC048172 TaxID=3365505 RepID=UPI00371FE71A